MIHDTCISRRGPSRRAEAGWVLAATLILSTLAVAVTVTYARHAVLAKKSLEFAKGASETEEASRSGLQRVRERMRNGDSLGTVANGTSDTSVTTSGELVVGERQPVGHDRRELRVRASGSNSSQDDEASIRARAQVTPASGQTSSRTRLVCDTGEQILLAGLVQIISTDVQFSDTELAGLFLIEEGATLDLHNVILRGTIITRAGLCGGNTPITGPSRPRVTVSGGLRLLAGTELPDVAMAAPDLRFEADGTSSVEIRGMSVADEIELGGRGAVRGTVVSCSKEQISSAVRRPGHGREPESFPETIECGGEQVTRLSFPCDQITEETLDLMIDGIVP